MWARCDALLDRCSHLDHDYQSIASSPAMSPSSATFSLFFPLPKVQWQAAEPAADCDDHSSITTSPSSTSSATSAGSVVDCTLSLGTPSSRRAAEPARHGAPLAHPNVSAWDVAADQPSYYGVSGKPAGGAARGAAHDALADRRCANCGTTSTPLWRNGPRGPKSLCNACGIRFKKEERRAAATAAMESGAAGCGYSAQRAQYEYGAAAAAAKASPGAAVSYGEGAFPCGGDADAGAPFLAWRLNVVAPAPAPAFAAVWPPERTSLFQYHC